MLPPLPESPVVADAMSSTSHLSLVGPPYGTPTGPSGKAPESVPFTVMVHGTFMNTSHTPLLRDVNMLVRTVRRCLWCTQHDCFASCFCTALAYGCPKRTGSLQAAMAQPPRPVDLLVRQGARVVMITGPVRALLNTYRSDSGLQKAVLKESTTCSGYEMRAWRLHHLCHTIRATGLASNC